MQPNTGTKKQFFFRTPTFKEMQARFYAGIIIGFFLIVGSYYLRGLFGYLLYGFGVGVTATAFLGNYHSNKIKEQIALIDALENDLAPQPDLLSEVTQEKTLTKKHKAPVPRVAVFRRKEHAAKRSTPHEQTSRSWNPLRFLWSNKQMNVTKPLEHLDANETCDNDISFQKPEEKKPHAKPKKNKVQRKAKTHTHVVIEQPKATTAAAAATTAISSALPQEETKVNTPPPTNATSSTLDVLKSLESPPSSPTSANTPSATVAVAETVIVNQSLSLTTQEKVEVEDTKAALEASLAPLREELAREREERAQEQKEHAREKAQLAQKQKTFAEVKQERDEYAGILVKLTSSDGSRDEKPNVTEAKRIAKEVLQLKELTKQKQALKPADLYSKHPRAYTTEKHMLYVCDKLVIPELSDPISDQTTSLSSTTSTASFR